MFEIFKPAKAIDRLPAEKIDKAYTMHRIGVFISIFIGYAGYYLIRKNFTIASPYLMKNYGFTTIEIGLVGTAMAISYGLSKFVMGSLADKCNARYYIATGLFLSAIANILFAQTANVYVMCILMVFIGIFQGMGAPACHKLIASWFAVKERGTKLAIWNCSHNIGAGTLAPLVGLALIVFGPTNWKSIFYVPSIVSIVLGILVILFGADTPQSVGLPSIEEYSGEEVKTKESNTEEQLSVIQIIYKYIIKNKYMWFLASVTVFIYLIRYGIQNWIPIYLTSVKGFSHQQARFTFAVFEYAAIPGVIFIGWLSDKVFKGKRAPMGIICMVLIIVNILIYWTSSSFIVINVCVGLMGVLVYGPQMLVALCTIDFVPKCAVGSACGFVGLFAYLIGEVSANLVIGTVVKQHGWNAGFYIMLAASILGVVFFGLLLNAKKVEEDVQLEEKVA